MKEVNAHRPRPEAYPENSTNGFYVQKGCCLGCRRAPRLAPRIVGFKNQPPEAHCYFKRQPRNESELTATLEALKTAAACGGALRFGGSDPYVLHQVELCGQGRLCDADIPAVVPEEARAAWNRPSTILTPILTVLVFPAIMGSLAAWLIHWTAWQGLAFGTSLALLGHYWNARGSGTRFRWLDQPAVGVSCLAGFVLLTTYAFGFRVWRDPESGTWFDPTPGEPGPFPSRTNIRAPRFLSLAIVIAPMIPYAVRHVVGLILGRKH